MKVVFYKAHGVRSSAPWQAATQSCSDNKCSFRRRRERARRWRKGGEGGVEDSVKGLDAVLRGKGQKGEGEAETGRPWDVFLVSWSNSAVKCNESASVSPCTWCARSCQFLPSSFFCLPALRPFHVLLPSPTPPLPLLPQLLVVPLFFIDFFARLVDSRPTDCFPRCDSIALRHGFFLLSVDVRCNAAADPSACLGQPS